MKLRCILLSWSNHNNRLACLPQRGTAASVGAGLPRFPADTDTRAGKLLLSQDPAYTTRAASTPFALQ